MTTEEDDVVEGEFYFSSALNILIPVTSAFGLVGNVLSGAVLLTEEYRTKVQEGVRGKSPEFSTFSPYMYNRARSMASSCCSWRSPTLP